MIEIAYLKHQSYVNYSVADILIIVMCVVLIGLDNVGRFNKTRQKQG